MFVCNHGYDTSISRSASCNKHASTSIKRMWKEEKEEENGLPFSPSFHWRCVTMGTMCETVGSCKVGLFTGLEFILPGFLHKGDYLWGWWVPLGGSEGIPPGNLAILYRLILVLIVFGSFTLAFRDHQISEGGGGGAQGGPNQGTNFPPPPPPPPIPLPLGRVPIMVCVLCPYRL